MKTKLAYNAEIRGLYNFYKIAENVSVLGDFYYIMKYSMLKTFAAKYKTRISRIRKKYGFKRFAVKYNLKGKECRAYFYDDGFKKIKDFSTQSDVDTIPYIYRNLNKTSLLTRLKAKHCEWCESDNTPIEIHHVRMLKDLKGKAHWEKIMIGRKRKTMAMCKSCHNKLHAGELD